MRRLTLCFGFGFVVFAAVFAVWFLRCYWSLRVFFCLSLFIFASWLSFLEWFSSFTLQWFVYVYVCLARCIAF